MPCSISVNSLVVLDLLQSMDCVAVSWLEAPLEFPRPLLESICTALLQSLFPSSYNGLIMLQVMGCLLLQVELKLIVRCH